MKNEILEVDKPESSVASLENKPSLMEMALKSGADISIIERLVALKEKEDDRIAERDFISAMSLFKTKVPVIKKLKNVSYLKTNYNFAGLDDISEQIKNVLYDCGLTYRFEQDHNDKNIIVRCIVSHVAGHSESCEMKGTADTSGGKNSIQGVGSTATYLMRYTLISALGITTCDQDIDGRLPAKEEVAEYSTESQVMVEYNLENYGKTWEQFTKVIKAVIKREETDIENLTVKECETIIRFVESKQKGKA